MLPHRGGGAETYIDFLERIPGYTHHRVALARPGGGPTEPVRAVSRLPALRRRARDFDVVHVHGDTAAALAVPVLGRCAGIVATTHGLHRLRRTKRRRPAAASRMFARVSVTICTSQSEHSELAGLLPADLAEMLETIPNGVEIPAADASDHERARAALGFSEGDVVVLHLGGLDSRKDPLLSADAVAGARSGGQPVTLILAGEGPLAKDLEQRADAAIRVLGHLDDPSEVLEAADIFVQPSWREGTSYALLEAMAHALPVIASDIPGTAETLDGSGVLLAPGDAAAWTRELENLAADRKERDRLGAAAQERVCEHFPLDTFLARTEAAYERALSGTDQGA